jgi:hypothetical protein
MNALAPTSFQVPFLEEEKKGPSFCFFLLVFFILATTSPPIYPTSDLFLKLFEVFSPPFKCSPSFLDKKRYR